MSISTSLWILAEQRAALCKVGKAIRKGNGQAYWARLAIANALRHNRTKARLIGKVGALRAA